MVIKGMNVFMEEMVVGICLADIRPAITTESGHGVLLFRCSDNENKGNDSQHHLLAYLFTKLLCCKCR